MLFSICRLIMMLLDDIYNKMFDYKYKVFNIYLLFIKRKYIFFVYKAKN